MYRPICLLLGLCLLLVACGGNTPAADPGPGNGAAGIATRVPTAPAPTELPPTVRPTATPTQARPTPTPTRPRPTPTATIVPTIAPTPPPARLKVETTTSDQTGKCKVGIPAGFTAEAGASDAWFSADRLVTALLLAPDTTGDPTLDVATGQGIAGLQKLVKDFKESDRATGPGFRRVAFTGSVNGKSSWGTLYIRQFGLDFCQFTVTASAGTTLLIDPVIETMIGSLSATKPRPLPLGYLALGDSYAAGVGADDPERGGYAALFGGTLQSPNGQPVGMQNRGIPGATSADLLGDWPTTGPAGKSPLAQAIGVLGAGGIRVVTIDIGGNDILRLLKPEQPCAGEKIETDGCQAALREALETMAGPNLPAILDALVESAQAGTQILVLTYPNPYSVGQQSPTERRVDQAMADLNAIIANAVRDLAPKAAARSVTLTLVDIAPIFAGKGGQLTHILAAKPDIHPNNAGHAAIAEAIARAYTK